MPIGSPITEANHSFLDHQFLHYVALFPDIRTRIFFFENNAFVILNLYRGGGGGGLRSAFYVSYILPGTIY